MVSILPPLPVVIPLSVAAILAALNKYMPRRVADTLAILASLVSGTLCVTLLAQSSAQPIMHWFGGWTPRSGIVLGISFVVEPLGAGIAAFSSLLALAAFIFSLRYFDSVGTLYHVLMLVFLAAMCGFSMTGDLFNLFVFFELMSASAFALCGYKTEEPGSMQGALNFAITNTIGAFLVLSGIALVYGRTGALNMAQIGRALATQADGLVITAMVFIMAGFLVKAAVFPFHFWLADAHAVAPTPVCILFSGVMVELGLYAVIRVYWSVMDTAFRAYRPDLEALLLGAGAATAVLGAIMCFGQRHIKRLLAFSTVSHMGLLTIGFALLAPDALAGAALYVVGHGLVKAALFMLAGILLHWLDSVDELELRGRARHLRGSGVLFLLAGLGLAGMPPFATFTGESLIEETASHQGYSWLAGVFFVAAVLTAGAVFRFAGRVFLGWGENFGGLETGKKIRGARETEPSGRVPLAMSFPVLVLVILALAAGIAVPLRQGTRRAAEEFERPAAYQARVLDQVWVPQSPAPPEAGPTNASLVRALAATACALGLAWFALSRYWPTRAGAGWAAGPMRALRSLHSGHIGDYVTFLTFGVAAFGLALALLIRLR